MSDRLEEIRKRWSGELFPLHDYLHEKRAEHPETGGNVVIVFRAKQLTEFAAAPDDIAYLLAQLAERDAEIALLKFVEKAQAEYLLAEQSARDERDALLRRLDDLADVYGPKWGALPIVLEYRKLKEGR